jgi:hypothetical protein
MYIPLGVQPQPPADDGHRTSTTSEGRPRWFYVGVLLLRLCRPMIISLSLVVSRQPLLKRPSSRLVNQRGSGCVVSVAVVRCPSPRSIRRSLDSGLRSSQCGWDRTLGDGQTTRAHAEELAIAEADVPGPRARDACALALCFAVDRDEAGPAGRYWPCGVY